MNDLGNTLDGQIESESVTISGLREKEPSLLLQNEDCACGKSRDTCECDNGNKAKAQQAPKYIYSIGRIEARFTSMDVEKEFSQAVGQVDTAKLSDQEVFHKVLTAPEHRYLARELCWVFIIEGLDTYVLVPRTDYEVERFIEAIAPVKGIDSDVIIGVRGPHAAPEMCNGLQLPVVLCDQIYSFSVDDFIGAITKPDNVEDQVFQNTARELLMRTMNLADNAGELDQHRALNYLTVRYPQIYAQHYQMTLADNSLSQVEVRPSRLSGARKIVQVIFRYINRGNLMPDAYFVRVDVTGKWPFLVSPLQPFYDR